MMTAIEFILTACASAFAGLVLVRKRGPWNLFAHFRRLWIIRSITKCEVCTTFWVALAFVACRFFWPGFWPCQIILWTCAVVGLALWLNATLQMMVLPDEE